MSGDVSLWQPELNRPVLHGPGEVNTLQLKGRVERTFRKMHLFGLSPTVEERAMALSSHCDVILA